ncbi:MAG: ArsR/SmtB family transcription factor [Dehalococcoidia bacterium]
MYSPLRQFKAELFKALAHPGRIRILDVLRSGEKTVGEIQELLHNEPANASQHLALLRLKGIVAGRKDGNNVYYSVPDPQVFQLLDVAREIFNSRLADTDDLLSEIADEEEAVAGSETAGG